MSIAPPTSLPPPPLLTNSELAALIEGSTQPLLLIDARPYSAFALTHITGSINVRLSNILVRRLASGRISVEDLLPDDQKALFQAMADRALIVVFDDKPFIGNDADTKLTVINALRTAGRQTVCLNGWWLEFDVFALAHIM